VTRKPPHQRSIISEYARRGEGAHMVTALLLATDDLQYSPLLSTPPRDCVNPGVSPVPLRTHRCY